MPLPRKEVVTKLPRKERVIEVPLHDGTLKQYVEMHLDAIGVIRHNEGVIKMEIGEPDKKGIRMIRLMFCEERLPEIVTYR
jgi:hypothetical protein